jgi:hypothetical protein
MHNITRLDVRKVSTRPKIRYALYYDIKRSLELYLGVI